MKQVLLSLRQRLNLEKSEMVRTLLVTEGFGFCFSLSCVFGVALDTKDSAFGSALQVICELLMAILITQLVCFAVLGIRILIQNTKTTKAHEEKTTVQRTMLERLLQWGIVSIVLSLIWGLVLMAYYPAVFSYDAEMQLFQVISGSYSTHHSLFHTLIMGGFLKAFYDHGGINEGMAAYALFQMFTMALMCGAAITFPWKRQRHISKSATIVLVGFFAIFPAFGILMISTTKDILFSGLIMLMVAFMLDSEMGKIEYIGVFASATLMMLFRNNALYAMVLAVGCLVVAGLKKEVKWKFVVLLLAAIGAAFVIMAGLKTSLHAESGSPREALSIPIQQMARVKALHGNEIEGELKTNLDELISDEWIDKYDEHLADPIKERISMKSPGLFVKTWIKLGCLYPGTYMDAWLLTTEGAWYLRDTSCNRIYGEGQISGFGYLSTDIRNMPEGFEVKPSSYFPELKNLLEEIVSDNAFEKIPVVRLIFAPALYFWMFIYCIYINVINKNKWGGKVTLFLLLYFGTIMLSPAILVRYMLPYMLVAPLLLAYKWDEV